MNTRPAEGKAIAWAIYDPYMAEFITWCWSREDARDLAMECDGCVICAVRVSH